MFCTGREFRLDRCRFDGWGVHDCNHAEAAGVVCDGQRARAIAQDTPQISPNAIPPVEKTAIRVRQYFLIKSFSLKCLLEFVLVNKAICKVGLSNCGPDFS